MVHSKVMQKSYIDDTYDPLPPKEEFRPNSSLGPEKIRMQSPKKLSSGNAEHLAKTTPRWSHIKQDSSTIKKFQNINSSKQDHKDFGND